MRALRDPRCWAVAILTAPLALLTGHLGQCFASALAYIVRKEAEK